MRAQRRRSTQKGAAMVEFALTFVAILLILFGIMEFGRIIYSYNILACATKEAARYAIVHGSRSGSPATAAAIETQLERWTIGLDRSRINVATTWDPSNTPGSVVRIQATYNVMPMTRMIFRNPLLLSSRAEVVISR